ncbi:hypothetical protein OAP18_01550, partial [Gammaproteobacteria bacterium]|nr:hypothetical protein [Gammaproteobacteria bacterium]
ISETSEAELQEMIAKMQQGLTASTECMAKIGEQELQIMQARAIEITDEVARLCRSDPDEAMEYVLSEGRKFSESHVVQEMKACRALLQAMGHTMGEMPGFEVFDDDSSHVCD